VTGRIALRLARLGFTDADGAGELLGSDALRLWDASQNAPTGDGAATVVAALGRSADPDAALRGLADLATAAGRELVDTLRGDGAFRARLTALMGASPPLARHLVAHPRDWRVLVGERVAPALEPAPIPQLRAAFRRELVAIAARDLAGELDVRAVTEALADLADEVLRTSLACAQADLPTHTDPCRLAIIAMGKAGARELNYVSDVDVIFVAQPDDAADEQGALLTASRLAAETMRVCTAAAWPVDAALRPEGKAGPLVRTLASHEAYYRRWASTWEFQALLKARPVAGDAGLGRRYLEAIAPLVWTAADRAGFVADVQSMRRRVLDHLPAAVAEREIKLGPGGLRDVEFAVQLLQLVHGRGDESLRVAATLPALEALRDGGYVGRDDALSLGDAYRFLRSAEHRVQLRRLRRTHLIPDDPDDVGVLARAMGYRPDERGDVQSVFAAEWALHGREVRRLHEKLFYRPLLEAVARVPSADLRLTPDEAGRRLAALGFADQNGALRHIEALTAGVSRRAALQRALLPAMLAYFAEATSPDAGLLAYRRVSEALGGSPWYLRLLRDEGAVAQRLAYLLGTSRYVAGMLERAPEALQLLADDASLAPRPAEDLRTTMADAAARQPDDAAAVSVVRGLRRQELLRTAFADLLGALDVVEVGEAITAITEATLDATLGVARQSVTSEIGLADLPIEFAVIAMGRLGGDEVGYGSDADVLFVYDGSDEPSAARLAHDVAERMRSLLAAPSTDPPLAIDADLRPEGRSGPLVRSLGSYGQYYARWSSAWEAQALLRARFAVGDAALGARFVQLIEPVRYPASGIGADDRTEIRRLKGRIEAERLPRGADPTTHLKLGRGGLTDIEWTVQLLQLVHGREVDELRTTRTLPALRGAAKAGLIEKPDADALEAAWRLAADARNAITLVRDRAEDQLPTQGAALLGVGRALGYPPGFDPGQLVDDWRRTARRARRVVERVFYG
jgi:glutamate-ammonia-ligase adenylyltransferase